MTGAMFHALIPAQMEIMKSVDAELWSTRMEDPFLKIKRMTIILVFSVFLLMEHL